MILTENQSEPGQEKRIDPEEFWATAEPLLQEQGVQPIDFVKSRIMRHDKQIESYPAEVFDTRGDLASPLLDTHRVLRSLLVSERQPFSEAAVKQIFPYWLEQLRDVEDYLEGR